MGINHKMIMYANPFEKNVRCQILFRIKLKVKQTLYIQTMLHPLHPLQIHSKTCNTDVPNLSIDQPQSKYIKILPKTLLQNLKFLGATSAALITVTSKSRFYGFKKFLKPNKQVKKSRHLDEASRDQQSQRHLISYTL